MSRGLGPTIFIGGVLALLTAFSGYLAVQTLARRRIELEGVTRQAVVVRRYTRSGDDSSRYYIDVRLGLLRQPSKEVSRHFYDSVSEGQTITIRHLRGNSSDFIIPHDPGPGLPGFVVFLFIAVLLLFWAVFIRECVRKATSARRAPDRPRRTRGPTHSTPDD